MHYAIIAAGQGERLRSEGVMRPKPLVRVAGESLLRRLVSIFMRNDADEIAVICNEDYTEVADALKDIQENGINGKSVPLRFIVKTTPGSMHSFHHLSSILSPGPFIMTTVDTIFQEEEFADYVQSFTKAIEKGTADALMGVSSYIDDEKPLYVRMGNDHGINAFLDHQEDALHVSAGIYGLTDRCRDVLSDCISSGKLRMREYQRALLTSGLTVKAYTFGKVLDIDHSSDIAKAESMLGARTLLIQRAKRFSPGAVEKDMSLLSTIAAHLNKEGKDTEIVSEEDTERLCSLLGGKEKVSAIVSMARSEEALGLIGKYVSMHPETPIVNLPDAVRGCHKGRIDRLMQSSGIPVPPSEGSNEYWLKRGDGWTESPEDIIRVNSPKDIDTARKRLEARGALDIIVQSHVEGTVVKFYGVKGSGFFQAYTNGMPYTESETVRDIRVHAEKISNQSGVSVYGGDCIVDSESNLYFIDFNDFPSFSPCRDEAVSAIISILQ